MNKEILFEGSHGLGDRVVDERTTDVPPLQYILRCEQLVPGLL